MRAVVPVGPATPGLPGSETRSPAFSPSWDLGNLALLGCLQQSQPTLREVQSEGRIQRTQGAQGWVVEMVTGGLGELQTLAMSCKWTALGPYQQGHTHKGRLLGDDSELGGAHGPRGSSFLIWGHCALCRGCGWRGDARGGQQGMQAVGVNGRHEGQRLDAQCVGSVLTQQRDAGLLGGDEAGGQAGCLRVPAPCRALAGLGVRLRFIQDHQLVGKVRLRLFRGHGVI